MSRELVDEGLGHLPGWSVQLLFLHKSQKISTGQALLHEGRVVKWYPGEFGDIAPRLPTIPSRETEDDPIVEWAIYPSSKDLGEEPAIQPGRLGDAHFVQNLLRLCYYCQTHCGFPFRIARLPKKKDLDIFVKAIRTLGANSVDTGYGADNRRSVGVEFGYSMDSLVFRLKKEGEE